MLRSLLVFARAPAREARAKGFTATEGAELFDAFARGWEDAARAVGARLLLATPRQDVSAWQGRAAAAPDVWLVQSGDSFGERLQDATASALGLGGHVVVVGGDVLPSAAPLEEAFALREAGCDAVVGGAGDGGVSLLSVGEGDVDLLRRLPPRRCDVFDRLVRALTARGRRLAVVSPLPDVDGRTGLRRALRGAAPRTSLRSLLRRLLARVLRPAPPGSPVRSPRRLGPLGLRAPPAAA